MLVQHKTWRLNCCSSEDWWWSTVHYTLTASWEAAASTEVIFVVDDPSPRTLRVAKTKTRTRTTTTTTTTTATATATATNKFALPTPLFGLGDLSPCHSISRKKQHKKGNKKNMTYSQKVTVGATSLHCVALYNVSFKSIYLYPRT